MSGHFCLLAFRNSQSLVRPALALSAHRLMMLDRISIESFGGSFETFQLRAKTSAGDAQKCSPGLPLGRDHSHKF